MAPTKPRKIEIENINHPGRTQLVDAHMHAVMKQAFLQVLPAAWPGLTLTEVSERLAAHLPADLFPGGAKAGGRAKTVQLDLEAAAHPRTTKYHPLMQVATGTVINGKVVVDGLDLVEGEIVTVLTQEREEGVRLSAQEEADLLEAIAEAERGETISAEELFARLDRIH